jgi:DNA mismatch repair protein MSH4
MTEMNYILKNVTDQSLVIIDELGRATSIEEGTAISWAMVETLMQHKAFVLLATHYLFLTKLESLYLNVLKYLL